MALVLERHGYTLNSVRVDVRVRVDGHNASCGWGEGGGKGKKP